MGNTVQNEGGLNRRHFLALVGGSVAGVAVLGLSTKAKAVEAAQKAAPSAPDAWVVQAVHPVQSGAIPVDVVNRVTGESIRIEICKRAVISARTPVARARSFDLFLANGGTGRTPTTREHAAVAKALAKRINREVKLAPAAMLTLDERLDAHRDLFDTNDDPVARA